ncbi:hypothetical protein [Paenibacillus sp. MMS20-IR301]|uniref:hypothetical protein n=1 Tax=Paenibacillus sp. MMS20-IR301 TaxID=2895946 RepID=UPI0028E1D9EC|nr:hypothetical protein [Paenibacillus sp. MMS20-IR301]WNS41694.1 hypothetical protein LOS79_22105 [Paenibacillus sp. MMS20-IR301]
MNINILAAGLKKDEIRFASEFGEGRGIWCGASGAAGETCAVEFELPPLFMRWVDIIPAGSSTFKIRMDGEAVILTGILENIEEDGTGYLRLGGDLIMFECLGEPMALGGFVEIRTRELRLYPVNF